MEPKNTPPLPFVENRGRWVFLWMDSAGQVWRAHTSRYIPSLVCPDLHKTIPQNFLCLPGKTQASHHS